jgi:hypothetical protein
MPSAAGNRRFRVMGKPTFVLSFALCAPVLFIGIAAPARADVYKCAGDDATPIYQEMPCAKGKELRDFQKDPPEITVLPYSPSASPPPPAKAAKDAKSAAPPKAKPAATETRDDAQRKFLHSGMTEAEVRTLAGSPDVTSGGNGRKTKRWQYMPSPTDPDTITALTFENGVVTSVERRTVRK